MSKLLIMAKNILNSLLFSIESCERIGFAELAGSVARR